jgi:hypothetical protein
VVRYELLEFMRKLILIGVLTVVSETSQAYLSVALVVSFIAALVFATTKPFVDPMLDRCSTRLICTIVVSEIGTAIWIWFACLSSCVPVTQSSNRLNLCALVVTCLTIFYGIAQANSSYGSVDDPQASSVQATKCFVLTSSLLTVPNTQHSAAVH